jgi:hypothetical protein
VAKKLRNTLSAVTTIFIISLVLNYMWESLHEAFFYEVFKCDAELYILMILKAASIDACIILGIYLGVAVLWRNTLWFLSMKKSQVCTVLTAGIIIATIIEYRGALVLKEWSYVPAMPTIFGIGLTPLIQLSVTGLLSLWLAKRFLYQRCDCE